VYAFTLAAILPTYHITTALTEIIWGTILFCLATILTNKITTTYNKKTTLMRKVENKAKYVGS
jgi:uncharacterized membrane protein